MGTMELFWWGLFGGVGAELAVVFSLRHSARNEYPYWLKSPFYYIIATIMAMVGGIVVLAHARSGINLTAILAIQIGASTPLILRKLRDSIPQETEIPDTASID